MVPTPDDLAGKERSMKGRAREGTHVRHTLTVAPYVWKCVGQIAQGGGEVGGRG